MNAPDDRLDLLLASADDGRPALDDGVPSSSVQSAKKPKKSRDDSFHWEKKGENPNLLSAQRWAVIAPKGKKGDAMLEAVAPLIRLRESEQGGAALRYRVDPDMDSAASIQWKQDVYFSEDVTNDDRPLYLMMLGDLDYLSIELQHTLQNDARVGRVHFADAAGDTDLDGYAKYAQKVVQYAKAGERASPESPNLLFYTAPDGTSATTIGRVRLVEPSLAAAQTALASAKLAAASVREISSETVEGLVEIASGAAPSVLLSVSHGLGAPRRGWGSEEEQWQRQGALVVGPNEVLDAERLRGQPFLPGGMWFFLACFGAGTPSTSAYATWLSELSKLDAYAGSLAAVQKSLPAPGERGFVAALPQAALLNPQGPLAVIGHMDLAWTYAFSGAERLSESRKSRIYGVLEELVRGSRAGIALDKLVDSYRQANDSLTISYQLEADARQRRRPDPTDHARRAHLWMLRNDLRGYVLLGDPAARLSTKDNFASEERPPANSERALLQVSAPEVAQVAGDVPALTKEQAIDATLAGEEPPRGIAERAGVSLSILWDWVFASMAERRGGTDS